MFALRGIAVSLTFFVLVYCLISALVAGAWRSVRPLHAPERRVATVLFSLRVLPLVVSVFITLAFVVPSFQLLEPRSVDEGIGALPLALGTCALLLIACGCYRVIAAQTMTSRTVTRWLEGAQLLAAAAETVIFCPQHETPPLTLVGLRKPRVLVSESTLALLSPDELQIALKHEHAHTRSHDNLRKLVLRFCPFPHMTKLEKAWSHAAELAADDAAVSNLEDAVVLAAALVKLSRTVPVDFAPICTTGFVTGSVSARVVRLLAWNEACKTRRTRVYSGTAILPVVATLLCVVATYEPALALTHDLTEWLVR
jgi:Zn-dependent protease with chaperone function